MGIRGVLWDMDGVLVDTGEFHFQSWVTTLSFFNIPFSREFFQESFGMNNRGVLNKLLGRIPDQELYLNISEQKEMNFRQLIRGQIQPLAGVVELLNLFKSKGIRQAISSSAPQENIDVIVDELNLRSFFEAIVSGNKLPGKPAPDVFLTSAQAIGIPAQDCLVIEDAIAGVEGAKRAGMLCLAVTNTNPPENLQKADLIVESLVQVDSGYLEKLFRLSPD